MHKAPDTIDHQIYTVDEYVDDEKVRIYSRYVGIDDLESARQMYKEYFTLFINSIPPNTPTPFPAAPGIRFKRIDDKGRFEVLSDDS